MVVWGGGPLGGASPPRTGTEVGGGECFQRSHVPLTHMVERNCRLTETTLCNEGGRTTWWCSGRMKEVGGMPVRQNCIW